MGTILRKKKTSQNMYTYPYKDIDVQKQIKTPKLLSD